MRRFREYDEKAEADWRILEFTSSSSNRDGLALRAAADGLLHRPEENKILIMLSDGRPNDVVLNRPNVKNLGVFAGEEQDLSAERRIFGKDFAYIRTLSTFAHVVGRYLKKQVDEQD